MDGLVLALRKRSGAGSGRATAAAAAPSGLRVDAPSSPAAAFLYLLGLEPSVVATAGRSPRRRMDCLAVLHCEAHPVRVRLRPARSEAHQH